MKMKASALLSNYNILTLKCVLTSVSYEDMMEFGEKLLAFMQREDVKEDGAKFEKFKVNDLIYMIKMNLIEPFYGKNSPQRETILQIKKYAGQLKEESNAEDGNLFVFAKYWDYMSGEITGNQYFKDLYEIYLSGADTCMYYETVLSIADASKMPNSFYIAPDVLYAVRFTDDSAEKTARLYAEIMQKFLSDINLAKKGCFDITVSGVIQRFLYCLDAYCGPKDILLKAIVNISIRQQVQTYLHSVMVQKIACQIAEELLVHEPEALLGFRGYQTVEEICSHADEIREYVYYAALLHDVGKIKIPEIINLQCRKLTDQEFGEIKNHPKYGRRLSERIPYLKEYGDIILGHHKSYDGRTGYPETFDNTTSPYRGVIDLISIADTIDAATDRLGRNYTAGKSFMSVLEEMKVESGTRYSPILVNFIERQGALKEYLSQLVGAKRTEIYRELYDHIMNR